MRFKARRQLYSDDLAASQEGLTLPEVMIRLYIETQVFKLSSTCHVFNFHNVQTVDHALLCPYEIARIEDTVSNSLITEARLSRIDGEEDGLGWHAAIVSHCDLFALSNTTIIRNSLLTSSRHVSFLPSTRIAA